jgi:hypothetical protein
LALGTIPESPLGMKRTGAVLLSVILAAGCGAPASDDAESGGSAAVDGNTSSQLDAGFYDSPNGMAVLFTDPSLGGMVSVQLALSNNRSASCTALRRSDAKGVVSFPLGKCKVDVAGEDPSAEFAVTPSADGTTFDLSGTIKNTSFQETFNEHFAARKSGVFDGTYLGDSGSGSKLVITDSAANSFFFRYELKVKGKTYKGEARSGVSQQYRGGLNVSNFDSNRLGNCLVDFIVWRRAGKVSLLTYAVGDNDDAVAVECQKLRVIWK